jgi:hypothetical protein
MTKKDYLLIAAALYETKPHKSYRHYPTAFFTWNKTVDSLSAKFKLQSSRYDEARFKAACGVERFREDDE